MGLRDIVSIVCSVGLSKGIRPFKQDLRLVKAATWPRFVKEPKTGISRGKREFKSKNPLREGSWISRKVNSIVNFDM